MYKKQYMCFSLFFGGKFHIIYDRFVTENTVLTFTGLAISPISTLTPTLKGSLQIVTLGVGVTVIQTRVCTLIDI